MKDFAKVIGEQLIALSRVQDTRKAQKQLKKILESAEDEADRRDAKRIKANSKPSDFLSLEECRKLSGPEDVEAPPAYGRFRPLFR